MDPRSFISNTPPFDRLGENDLRLVERSLEIRYVSRGEAVLRRGDAPTDRLFVIRKGAVRLERDGRLLQMLEDGELFGYPSLLSDDSPTADVITEEESLLYTIPKEVFDRLLAVPQFGEYFLDKLAQRLRSSVSGEPALLAGSLSNQVSALVTRPAVFVEPETPVAEAARIMSREHISSVIVSSEPPGIVTDRDLRNRVLAAGTDPSLPVRTIMSQPLRSVPARSTLFEALMTMLEGHIHHLPVANDRQELTGVLTDTDLLRHQLKSPLYLLRLLDRLDEPEEFSGYAGEIAAMVDVLFQGNLDTLEIGRIVARLNDAAAKRLLRRAELALGPPPAEYAWIVFGSEGRMEQALLTDQDNAIVYADGAPEAEAYFERLAHEVVSGLAKLGIPRCPGGFMATHWRMPLSRWRRQFLDWIDSPDEQALIDASNFFDFRAVHGSLPLDSLDDAIATASTHRIFLGLMAKNSLTFKPPLGLFRRIRERSAGVDLKKGGIIPIVSIARMYALELAIRDRSTVDRLDAAAARGNGISEEGAEVLRESFRFLLHLRLKDQLTAHRAHEPVDNCVRLDDLSPLDRRHLKDAFVAIADFQHAIAQRYSTHLVA
jgi:CBS domain-containing protein